MENKEIDIKFYKNKSKKSMYLLLGLISICLIAIFFITLYNDLLYEVIGKVKFLVVYIVGFILCVAYLVLYYSIKISDKDVVFSILKGTKKEDKFYEIFPENEKYKMGKKSKFLYIFKNILEYYFIITIAILCVVVMFTFIMFPAEVEQHSMETTLFEGNKVLVFNSKKAKKQDIVVFEFDNDYQKGSTSLDGDLLIKRVIATSGDSFECVDGHIYINGQLLVEDYVNPDNFKDSSYTLEDVVNRNQKSEELLELIKNGKIPDGYYLVLGDNRNNSNDSEEFGLIYYKQLIGVVKYYQNDFGWHKN